MRYAFFTIPIHNPEPAAAELNRFIAAHKVVSQDQLFVQDGPNSAWVFCVRYEGGAEAPAPSAKPGRADRVDYKDVLPEAEFNLYAQLRDLRKQLAEREGVPVYALFTNQQLAEMVQRRVTSLTALREIVGIGEGKTERYGNAFVERLRQAFGA